MKKNRITLVLFVLLAALVLAGCSALPVPYWPGASGGQNVAYVSYGGSMEVVDAATGARKCGFPTDKVDAAQQLFAMPVTFDGTVIAGGLNNVLHALDSSTCVEKWTFTEARGKWVASPIIVDGSILAANGDGHLYALDMSGKLKWKYAATSAIWATPVSDGKVVYVPSQDRNLYAINIADGTLVWKKDLGAASLYFPILEDGTIYLSTVAKNVLAINTSDGSIKWPFSTQNDLYASPVMMGSTLYIGDLGNKIYAISKADGSQ